jgi:hypothetical protein
VRSGADWADIELGAGLRLILGWRGDDGGLEGYPVEVKNEIADEMRDACQATLSNLGERDAKPYSGMGNVAADEFLRLAIQPAGTDGSRDDEDEATDIEELLSAADLVSLAQGAFEQTDFLTRDDLEDGGWLFYMVVVEVNDDGGGPLAFVRQYNPQRGFGAGRLLSFFSDALTRATDPLFVFDLSFDVVVAPDEVAVLGVTQFQRVFADVGVVAAEVPADTVALTTALNVPLTDAATLMLTEVCQEKLRLAARLRKLARQPHLSLVTSNKLKEVLDKHGLPRHRFGAGEDVVLGDLADVREFLDILEKRYYEADFTEEPMRADNASPR